jgi:D-3-phosphoglycerate dehydrogenase / 2-oxoglutarate reductase
MYLLIKLSQLEKFGPESVSVPEDLLEHIVDADLLLVHFAPVSKRVIGESTKLKAIGTCRGGLEHINVSSAETKGNSCN